MNCKQIKNVSIIDFLARIGIQPKNVKNGSMWYNSPLRNESTPSFKVNHYLNAWYDFGIGEGGGILDLVMKLNRTDIAGALEILNKQSHPIPQFFSSHVQNIESKIQIENIRQLHHYGLLQYLYERRISYTTAVHFTKEAYYKVNGKKYFALAFENDKGGFELRNKYFKGSSSPKTITTIKGFSKAVNIFEGFIDFLSALEHYNIRKPSNTTIVLNSISNLESALEILPKYERINLYLDNDDAGKRATNIIESKFGDVKSFAETIYPDYKDFNEMLQKSKLPKS
jgi:DNA primase